jgi:hypothetical protein
MIYFLEQIRDNKEGSKLTHKQVRAYGRLMLDLAPTVTVDHPERIQFLLTAMAAPGLPHYDRSFAAEQIINLLDELEKRRSLSSEEVFKQSVRSFPP